MAGLARLLCAAAGLAAAACWAAPWDSIMSPRGPAIGIDADLICRTATIPASGKVDLGILLNHRGGSHSYWINPGSAGYATSVEWTLPKGASAGGIIWPAPSSFRTGKQISWGYSGEVLLQTQITLPPGIKEATVGAHVSWLVCKDLCVPGEKDIEIRLKAGSGAPSAVASAFEKASRLVPQAAGLKASFDPKTRQIELQVPGRIPDTMAAFAADPEIFESATPQAAEKGILRVRASDEYRGGAFTAVIAGNGGPAAGGWAVQGRVTPQAAALVPEKAASQGAAAPAAPQPAQAGASAGFMAAVAMAFAGGLILNLMPCVFPVLSLKILGLVKASRDTLALHGLAFAGGVQVTMLALAGALAALRLAGSQVGWGFQLQSPAVVAILTLLFAAITLNLLGVFEITASAQGTGRSKGLKESFLTGILAVFVASPCTAPFMGAALGYAVTQPVAESAAVFIALGLGMAAPWVLITLVPGLASRLPRPGSWMNVFRAAMAVPMGMSALWLGWVFFQQAGTTRTAVLAAAVVALAGALWLWGRLQWGKASSGAAALVLAAACTGLTGWSALSEGSEPASAMVHEGWGAWSPAAVNEAVASRQGAFVDFTAAWCLTCQANHQLVFARSDVQQALKKSGLKLLVADWTNRNRAIAAELARFGRTGIPLYVVYRADGTTQVLPEIPLPSDVIRAVAR